VDRFNNLLVSAFVTPGGARLLLLHDGRGDDVVRAFFTDVYELYLRVGRGVGVGAGLADTTPQPARLPLHVWAVGRGEWTAGCRAGCRQSRGLGTGVHAVLQVKQREWLVRKGPLRRPMEHHRQSYWACGCGEHAGQKVQPCQCNVAAAFGGCRGQGGGAISEAQVVCGVVAL
jgi:hypothetical protein